MYHQTIKVTQRVKSSLLSILPEVSQALKTNKPVVALESTILAHGLPYPENINLANNVSEIIRSKGAIPATIAIQNGKCRIGLELDEIHDLAHAGLEQRAQKCSTKDIPSALLYTSSSNSTTYHGNKTLWGATTVASTMYLAHLAGISTFVTGGTGGVHRGGESSMDISADLIELSRTPVIVVSAGIKSILDIKRTIEQLETLGVTTASYGTNEFPAFFSPRSGIKSPHRFDSSDDIARAFLMSRELNLPNGMLVAVPNMNPAGEEVEKAIQESLQELDSLCIDGRDVTPFILKRVAEKTGGDSLRSNIALVKRNAEVGADIAVSISKQISELNGDGNDKDKVFFKSSGLSNTPRSRVLVMGGSVHDIVAKVNEERKLISGTSNPGNFSESDGGVGRNIAEVLGRLGAQPILYSAVGNDSRGQAMLKRMEMDHGILGVGHSIQLLDNARTATYLALLDSNGELHAGIADMKILSEIPLPTENDLKASEILVVDANAPVEKLIQAAKTAVGFNVKVFFEPTSVPKVAAISRRLEFLKYLSCAFPNGDELLAMTDGWDPAKVNKNSDGGYDFDLLKSAATEVLFKMMPESASLVVTLGPKGVLYCRKDDKCSILFEHIPTKVVKVKNCTGAGDTLAGAFIKAILDGYSEVEAVKIGMKAAVISLTCEHSTISPEIAGWGPSNKRL